VVSNIAFYTSSSHRENLSEINAELYYDTKAQKVFVSRSEIWAQKNNYKVVTDVRWEKFPEDTYGLGIKTTDATINHIDFLYVKAYATLLKKITPDLYGGIGYNLDYHYNITGAGNADNSVSDFKKYGEAPQSTSSGVNFDVLYDSRRNLINPINGAYASVSYRDNGKLFGSDNSWKELRLDLRKYIRPSASSNNILAFWSILAFTSGNVPYLDLPSTGSDMCGNSGRGYVRDRFRGKNMLYLEGEYRFGITKNGLIGGVAFANGESFSEIQNNRFEKIAPVAGAGLRVKINKHSNTNICIDYGVGTNGSHGFLLI
jgi:outer membrane protein assembly factor BamA